MPISDKEQQIPEINYFWIGHDGVYFYLELSSSILSWLQEITENM
jgi:hypothetical protein